MGVMGKALSKAARGSKAARSASRQEAMRKLRKTQGKGDANLLQPAGEGEMKQLKSADASKSLDRGADKIEISAVAKTQAGRKEHYDKIPKMQEKQQKKIDKIEEQISKYSGVSDTAYGKAQVKKLKEKLDVEKFELKRLGNLKKSMKKKHGFGHGGMAQGMRMGHNDMRKVGMFYGGMAKKKK